MAMKSGYWNKGI